MLPTSTREKLSSFAVDASFEHLLPHMSVERLLLTQPVHPSCDGALPYVRVEFLDAPLL